MPNPTNDEAKEATMHDDNHTCPWCDKPVSDDIAKIDAGGEHLHPECMSAMAAEDAAAASGANRLDDPNVRTGWLDEGTDGWWSIRSHSSIDGPPPNARVLTGEAIERYDRLIAGDEADDA